MKTRYISMTAVGAAACAAVGICCNFPLVPDARSAAATSLESTAPPPTAYRIVCSGIVEAVQGEVDVSAQISGAIAKLTVKEGDRVQQGDVIAVLEGARESAARALAQADVALSRANLAKLKAGTGKEELEEARLVTKATEADLVYVRSSLERTRKLFEKRGVSRDQLEKEEQQVKALEQRLGAQRKHYDALKRGALPEEIAVADHQLTVAEAKLKEAEVESGYRTIRAPITGVILTVHRHAGDSVAQFAPIVRMSDANQLRIRLEVDESDVPQLRTGLTGDFEIRGSEKVNGQMTLTTIVPTFGPKRLFNPDASARQDTRALDVLCEPHAADLPLYPGQRVTARLDTTTKEG